jgi:hypothetical protein
VRLWSLTISSPTSTSLDAARFAFQTGPVESNGRLVTWIDAVAGFLAIEHTSMSLIANFLDRGGRRQALA